MKFSYTKNTESDFVYKETKPNKTIWPLGGEGVGVWLGLVFFFLFSIESKSEKKLFSF